MLKGIRGTTIIDSSYNANVDSVTAVLNMVKQLPSESKWLILGDLIEQGEFEKEEHERVARILAQTDFQKIILVGPRSAEYVLPLLDSRAVSFTEPKDALDYLKSSLNGREVLVFKGARFLEGIIEHLLLDKSDADKLCRREAVWQQRRKKWGL